jgi:hypothetical protein
MHESVVRTMELDAKALAPPNHASSLPPKNVLLLYSSHFPLLACFCGCAMVYGPPLSLPASASASVISSKEMEGDVGSFCIRLTCLSCFYTVVDRTRWAPCTLHGAALFSFDHRFRPPRPSCRQPARDRPALQFRSFLHADADVAT